MLHRAGCITDTTCYYVFHLDTEKISGPSLLAKIIQYSEMKSDKYTNAEMKMILQQENILLKLKMHVMKS